MRTKLVTRPHEKNDWSPSQLQAIDKLASGVQELARVNAKYLKVENQDLQQLLEFRREEAEKTRKYEKEMAERYFKMMRVQQSNNFRMNLNQQSQIYNVSFPENIQPAPLSLSTYMSSPLSPVH